MTWVTVITLYLTCIDLSQESLNALNQNPCIRQNTCGECIAVSRNCAWCQAPNYDEENKARCNLISDQLSCPEEHLISPKSDINRTQDEILRDGDGTQRPIQLQPQIIYLKIRPNDPQKFTVNFRLAKNYPVDLYYLMDLSYSMRDDKDKLATLGVNIANEMKNITDNFRLGFGSFVDKAVMPYICKTRNNTSGINCPKKINNGDELDSTYGFKNQLSLTDNPGLFQDQVRNAKMSGNIDAPEGGFDAVMQVVACETQIGWRNPSRKMLLYTTDAGFHHAGDGKLGGIIKPNDGECHLVNNIYTESTTQDYPSVSQIASKIKEKNVHLVFAVTENKLEAYSQLMKVIPGSETGRLDKDSANIVDIIRENYQKITSKVLMSSDGEDDVIIRYFTKCKNLDGELLETNYCDGLKIGDSISFEVEVEVKECRKGPNGYTHRFYIETVGLPDKVEVRMEVICKCNCEKSLVYEQNKHSPNCNNHGTFVCGTCDCDDKYYGKTCDCFIGNNTETDKDECTAPNSTALCSERGRCICGTCECKSRSENSPEKYSGKWCQCDSYSCPFYSNALCGGPSHGICDCGKCSCTPSFTGENCGCTTRNDSCIASDGSLCGGPDRGDCKCNKCVCVPGSKYHGSTCEDCKDCKMICRQNKACVQCVAYGTGELKDNCAECKAKNYISVQNVLPDGYNSCEFKDEDDCIFYFTYNYDVNNEVKIIAQRGRECPTEVNAKHLIAGVVVGIVLVGLVLLLIWKLFTTINDRRELARFLLETKDAKWDTSENPIYNPAVSTYRNPTYSVHG